MAFSRTHSSTADSSFTASGKADWEAAHTVSGATVGGIPYCPTATSEKTSSNLTYDESVRPLLSIGSGSTTLAGVKIGHSATSGIGGMWTVATATPDFNNCIIAGSATATYINAPVGNNTGLVLNNGVPIWQWDSRGISPNANGGAALGYAAVGWSKIYLDYTNTATVGDVTINKPSGRVNLGAGGTTLTLTNSLITAASRVFLNSDSAPGNVVAVQFYAVPGAGSCTINAVPAVTNQTAIDFLVINAD